MIPDKNETSEDNLHFTVLFLHAYIIFYNLDMKIKYISGFDIHLVLRKLWLSSSSEVYSHIISVMLCYLTDE